MTYRYILSLRGLMKRQNCIYIYMDVSFNFIQVTEKWSITWNFTGFFPTQKWNLKNFYAVKEANRLELFQIDLKN